MGRRYRRSESSLAALLIGVAVLAALYLGRHYGPVAAGIVLGAAAVAGAVLSAGGSRRPKSDPSSGSVPPLRAFAWLTRRPPAPTPRFAPVAAPAAWSLSLIRELEWKRFEDLCAGYWRAKGYALSTAGTGGDGGVDIRLFRPSAPGKVLAIVQCKSRINDLIGVHYVRELFGVMHHEQVPLGILMTSSDFTAEARRFAQGKPLKLIAGSDLLALLTTLPEAERDGLLAEVTAGDYQTPTCPNCGVKLVARHTRGGLGKPFWGCPNFASTRRCGYTLPMTAPAREAHARQRETTAC